MFLPKKTGMLLLLVGLPNSLCVLESLPCQNPNSTSRKHSYNCSLAQNENDWAHSTHLTHPPSPPTTQTETQESTTTKNHETYNRSERKQLFYPMIECPSI